jgi:hypothetical protein
MHTDALPAVAAAPSLTSAQDAGAPALDSGKSGSARSGGSADDFTQALAAMMGLAGAPTTPPAATTSTAGGGQASNTTSAALTPSQAFAAILPAPANANAPAGAAQAQQAGATPTADAILATLTGTPPATPGQAKTPPPATPAAATGASSFSAKLTGDTGSAANTVTDARAAQPQTQPPAAPSDQADVASAPATTLAADAAALAPQPTLGASAKPVPAAAPPTKALSKLDAANTPGGMTTASAAADRPAGAVPAPQTPQDAAEGDDHNARSTGDGPARTAEAPPPANDDDQTNLNALTTQAGALQAPVQTTAASAAAGAGPAIVGQLAAQVAKNVEGKSTRFDVALDPAGLGHVDVKVEINAQGQVTAQFSFDNAHAAAEAKSQSSQLQQALEQAGFNVGQGGLSFDVGGQGAGLARQDAPPPQSPAATTIQAPDIAAAPTAIAAAAFPRSSSGVDITI